MSFVEFYPKLGATIAFGTMAAAARMIPTSGAATSDAPQAKDPELVSFANISSPPKRRTAQQSSRRKRGAAQQSIRRKRGAAQQSSARKRGTAHKTRRKTAKRATGRRKAA